jgi:hypothetical protein
MTETEWLASKDPCVMQNFLRDEWGESRRKIGRRRLRLFACACVRGIWPLLRNPGSRQALYYAELYADGQTTEHDLATATQQAKAAVRAEYPNFEALSPAHGEAAQAAGHAVAKRYDLGNHPSVVHATFAAASAWAKNEGEVWRERLWWQRQAVHADWLRDIYGNPFRSVAFSPQWRTDTATALARQMYESREFDAMPILADALQDAGCDCDEVLNHLRDASVTHVRGCWVTDLVLNRS